MAFSWGAAGGAGSAFSEDKKTFTKARTDNFSFGAIGAAPLPLTCAWLVKWKWVGLASVGVARKEVQLESDEDSALFGEASSDSWALQFSRGCKEFAASHKGVAQKLEYSGAFHNSVELGLRRAGCRLSIFLPDGSERVICSDLPEGEDLYAVASTDYGHQGVTIEELTDKEMASRSWRAEPVTHGHNPLCEKEKPAPKKPRLVLKSSEAFATALAAIGEDGDWQLGRFARAQIKSEDELDPDMRKELEYILSHCDLPWTGRDLSELFAGGIIDDNSIARTTYSSGACPALKLSYWEAGCGDNSFGALLEAGERGPSLLLTNTDTDIAWPKEVPGSKSPGFAEQFAIARYGKR